MQSVLITPEPYELGDCGYNPFINIQLSISKIHTGQYHYRFIRGGTYGDKTIICDYKGKDWILDPLNLQKKTVLSLILPTHLKRNGLFKKINDEEIFSHLQKRCC